MDKMEAIRLSMAGFKKSILSQLPQAEVVFVLSPGIASIDALGQVNVNNTYYAYWRINRAVMHFAHINGYRVLDTESLVREMYGHAFGLSRKNSLRLMYKDNFHPCVPSVDIPWISLLLASF